MIGPDPAERFVQPSFQEAFRLWLKIGLLSFGGPAGQIALMHRMIVEEKKWIEEDRFLHALNFCMLLPGPEAQQLSVYIGWLLHRTLGGLVAGILFVAPGFLVMLLLSILYVQYADLKLIEGLFLGIKTAVIAIVVEATLRIGGRALKNGAMYLVSGIAFVAIFLFAVPFPLIILGAAIIGLVGGKWWPDKFGWTKKTAHSSSQDMGAPVANIMRSGTGKNVVVCAFLWIAPIAALCWFLGPDSVFVRQAVFFSEMAVVTFGGAYAVLAYVAQQAVDIFGWLTPGEMIDGLGLAETTPGPLIMVVQFVGFLGAFRADTGIDPLTAGILGAVVTTWVTFIPCFLWIFLGAPVIEQLRNSRSLSVVLSTITAAVVGVVLNLAIWFSAHVIFDSVDSFSYGPIKSIAPDVQSLNLPALALSAFGLILVFRFKIGMIPVLVVLGGTGVVWSYLG